MSTYKRLTKNPETKQFELATWHDNYFGEHNYGVIFDSHPNVVFDPREEPMETKDFNTSGSNAIGYNEVQVSNKTRDRIIDWAKPIKDSVLNELLAKVKAQGKRMWTTDEIVEEINNLIK